MRIIQKNTQKKTSTSEEFICLRHGYGFWCVSLWTFDDNWLFLLSLIIVQLNCQASISRQLREKCSRLRQLLVKKKFWDVLIAYLDLPVVCRICAFSPQKKPTPKGRNFTYLEDPGIVSWNVRLRGQAVFWRRFFRKISRRRYFRTIEQLCIILVLLIGLRIMVYCNPYIPG